MANGRGSRRRRDSRDAQTSAQKNELNSAHATSLPAPVSSDATQTQELTFQELQRLSAIKTEFFGFAGWIASVVLYVLFLIWAYVPDDILEAHGLTYSPSKRWALAVPAMVVVTYLFSIVLYKAVNLMATPALDSYATILDVHSVFPEKAELDAHSSAATPPIADLPLMQVNQHIFRMNEAA